MVQVCVRVCLCACHSVLKTLLSLAGSKTSRRLEHSCLTLTLLFSVGFPRSLPAPPLPPTAHTLLCFTARTHELLFR